MSGLVPGEPADMRLSDQEREAVAEFLRDHVGEGRLTLDELAERLEVVYGAKVRGDLAGVTDDLPVPAAAPVVSRPPARPARFDAGLRTHLQLWALGWFVAIPVALVTVAALVLMAIWTGVLILHWLRVQGDRTG